MGMAYEAPKIKRKGKNGLKICSNCNAEYSNNGNWVRGYNTSTGPTCVPDFHPVKRIPIGVCPVCETPEDEE